jgi:HlyD family secretion protein
MNARMLEPVFRSLSRQIAAGAAAIVLLMGGIGGWAATTELSGAVIAPGMLVVDGSAKKVQHPGGGVVAELLVREGKRVEAGEVLLRLDETVTRAGLALVAKGLDQLLARQARLEAERDGLDELAFPPGLAVRAQDGEVLRAMEGERRLFEHRRAARAGEKAQLAERIEQLHEQIRGLDAQQEAKAREIALIEEELAGVRALFAKGLVPVMRVNALDRSAARLGGERGQLVAAIAEARGRIVETELQILQIDQELRREVAAELREVEGRQGELEERRIAAEDELARVELKAPIAGMVHELAVHTVGGVIAEGEELMRIVPRQADLTVEARVAPQDVDQLRTGQPALLRFVAFNQNRTPELTGEVSRISADLVVDDQAGTGFYRVGITIPQEEAARLGGLRLVPGMPVEAFIRTGDRTVLSYLSKPIGDHAARAFREE